MIKIGFIIKQTWWHVEEIYFPSNARKIRQVMDVFTSQTEIPIEFGNGYEFVGLRVIARNCPNKEIAFLEKKDDVNSTTLILNLGSLDIFPVVPNRKGLKCRHVKIEIEYISTNPEITDSNYLLNWDEIPGNDNGRLIEFLKRKSDNDWVDTARIEKTDDRNTIKVSSENNSIYLRLNNNKTEVKIDKHKNAKLIAKQENGILNIYESSSLVDKFYNTIFPKKRSTIEIKGKIQPELYLTLPLGWRIRGPREKRELFKKVFGIDKEGYSVGMVCKKDENPGTSSDKPFEIIFNKPFISQNQGKRTYSYSIDADNFSKLNGYLKNNITNSVSFEFTYFAKISTLIGLISLIPYVFLIFSFVMLACRLFSVTYSSIVNLNIVIGYFVIVLSFAYFYYSLIKDGYDIPRKYQHILIFMFSIATIFIIFLIEVSNQSLNQSFMNITNNVSN